MYLGKPIANGRNSEVYPWGNGWILKLFRDRSATERVEYEARIARIVQAAGLPSPAVGEVIVVNGRPGLIYERLEGPCMLEKLKAQPWTLFASARLFAKLHTSMHACVIHELPSLQEHLENQIRAAETLPPNIKEAVLRTLHKKSDGDRLCHGDFHPNNVLMTTRGPIIIDWVDATRGNLLADVARTSLLLNLASSPPGTSGRPLLDAARRWFHTAYLNHYFELRPGDQRQLSGWRAVVAAARLSENVPGEQFRLLSLIKAGVSHN